MGEVKTQENLLRLGFSQETISETLSMSDSDFEYFYGKFSQKSINPTTLFLMSLMPAWGIQYIYWKRTGVWFLYVMTVGGVFIWWIYDLFTLKKRGKEYNQTIAVDTLDYAKGRLETQKNINLSLVDPPNPTSTNTNSRLISVKSETECSMEQFLDKVTFLIPELEDLNWYKNKDGKHATVNGGEFIINDTTITVDKIEIEKFDDFSFNVFLKYNLEMRGTFIWFVIIGLIFGIIPGLLIYLIGRRTPEGIASTVSPALDRIPNLINLRGKSFPPSSIGNG